MAFLRDVNESLYEKRLPAIQATSLGLDGNTSSHKAIKLQLSPGEFVCVVENTGEERIFMGPQGLLLGPLDEVKVLSLSGGKPKGSTHFNVSKIFTGPDFMSDVIVCTTMDNMEIEMHVTYKWELLVNPTTAVDLFNTEDFVGVACRKLQAKIREAAAMYKFADFKVDTVRHLQGAIFSTDQALPSGNRSSDDGPSLYLEDIRFLVTEVDVKGLEASRSNSRRNFKTGCCSSWRGCGKRRRSSWPASSRLKSSSSSRRAAPSSTRPRPSRPRRKRSESRGSTRSSSSSSPRRRSTPTRRSKPRLANSSRIAWRGPWNSWRAQAATNTSSSSAPRPSAA
mmetsp:Transcript_62065/g.140387  ORF Transcript_62065/g.140387 Transcript_62065/m.140387 type:complete len:338 (+) Transcript_62065:37-1050(+)